MRRRRSLQMTFGPSAGFSGMTSTGAGTGIAFLGLSNIGMVLHGNLSQAPAPTTRCLPELRLSLQMMFGPLAIATRKAILPAVLLLRNTGTAPNGRWFRLLLS